jgi:hypothetical protein
MLRHTLATLAYRAGKALRGAPPEFSAFRCADGSRSAGEILAHMCDLMDWAASIARGAQTWKNSQPGDWDADVRRFFDGLAAFDGAAAQSRVDESTSNKLFQGPIADALQHTGQLTMMRRLVGAPIRGENYFVAEITTGRVRAEQAAPRREFD